MYLACILWTIARSPALDLDSIELRKSLRFSSLVSLQSNAHQFQLFAQAYPSPPLFSAPFDVATLKQRCFAGAFSSF
jgi:hypothetical protein